MTDDDRVTAAELAIGLLAGEEHVRARSRAIIDPAFAQEVEWWQQRLAPFYAQVAEESPPPYLRERIASRLDVPMMQERRGTSSWRLVGFGGALGALAASIIAWMMSANMLAPTVSPPQSVIASRPLVASLLPTDETKEAPVVVLLERDTRRLSLSAKIQAPDARDVQLWLIRAGATPISLGVLSATSNKSLRLQRTDLPDVGDALAASIEPLGGSPTGKPTGPVVLSGAVAEI